MYANTLHDGGEVVCSTSSASIFNDVDFPSTKENKSGACRAAIALQGAAVARFEAPKMGRRFTKPLGRVSGLKARCPSFNQFKFIVITGQTGVISCFFFIGAAEQNNNNNNYALAPFPLATGAGEGGRGAVSPFGLQEGATAPPSPLHLPVTVVRESESAS